MCRHLFNANTANLYIVLSTSAAGPADLTQIVLAARDHLLDLNLCDVIDW